MPSIVITGCSSGFGRVTTLRFLGEGWDVIATVRTEGDRSSLTDEAARAGGRGRLTVVLADITRERDVAALRDAVASAAPGLNALLNNAGTAYPGVQGLLPVEDLRAQLEINVIAHFAVTQALLPLLITSRGIVINVSSIAGRIATPGLGAYNASKFALEALSDALRVEMAPLGVRVAIIEPGSYDTKIWETGRLHATRGNIDPGPYASLMAAIQKWVEHYGRSVLPPEAFAQTVWEIVNSERPHARYALPGQIRRAIFIRRFLPDRVVDWIIRRALKI